MNQTTTGKFIAFKRKEKNLTQEQLAEKLGISNKTVSKWENGKCMPDYSLVQPLCKALEITIAELIDGEARAEGGSRVFDERQIVDMMERIQALVRQKLTLFGLMLVLMGIALLALSQFIGGTDFRDFLSGLLTGLSVGEMLVGVYVTARSFLNRERNAIP